MSKKYPGGLVKLSNVLYANNQASGMVPSNAAGFNPAYGAAAPGIWTLDQAEYFSATRQWPIYDPYFENTTLLLHGNGTNGAQNNTFLDSSSNNFTITRNGNTTQGTFSPFSQTGWGNYFNGTSGYFTAANNTAYDLSGATSWCVEAWVYFNSVAGEQNIVEKFTGPSGPGWTLYKVNNGAFEIYGGSSFNSAVTPVAGQWYYIVVCRDNAAGRTSFFVNGTRTATSTTFSISNNAAVPLYVGVRNGGTTYFNGYMSNLRIVKGSSVYDTTLTSITVPTSPLTAITNTSFLSCQSNRFVDNSSNAAAITVSGTPSVQAFSPFAPTDAYSTSAVGGSAYFDGSGDYLSVPDSAALELGSSSFTMEGWFYPTDSAARYLFSKGNGALPGTAFDFQLLANRTVVVNFYNGASAFISFTTTGTLLTNSWNHFAIVRNGSSFVCYINGVSSGSGTSSTAVSDVSSGITLGILSGVGSTFLGYCAGFRVVIGTALYTSAFTPPAAPPTPVTNTQLLLNFTNGGITDATGKNLLETVGTAQITTSFSKYGGGAISFSGTGAYLTLPDSQNFNFGAGDFTIEAWIYPTVVSGEKEIYSKRTSTGSYTAIQVGVNAVSSTNRLFIIGSLNGSSWGITGTSGTITIPTNAFTHIAVVRSGTTIYGFVNGVLDITITGVSGSLMTNTSSAVIGASTTAGDNAFNGYVDDFRITKYARYTGNFTPPTSQFQDQ